MPNNNATNPSPSISETSSDVSLIHEKNCLLKVRANERNKRSENIFKKNVALSAFNTDAAQQDKNRETRPAYQGKTQFDSAQKNEVEAVWTNKEKNDQTLNSHNTASTSKTICSCTQCVVETKQIESTLKDLRSQIQELLVELINYKNENQLLRKDINMAKSFIKRDIGRNVESFEDIVKKMTEDSWIGQQEKIISLKKDLRVLKDELREKGPKPSSPVKTCESISPDKISNDRKVHWRLTLERQSILRQKEQEKRDLITDRNRLKEKVKLILNRNKDLGEQAESIRQEIQKFRKGSNGKFISRLHDMEKQTKFCLEEKSKLRRSVAEEETKEKLLIKKVEDLKAQLDSQKTKFEITQENLSKMKSGETEVLSLVTAFESAAVSGLSDIDENINEVEEGQAKNEKQLNIFIDLIFTFEEFFSQQRPKTPVSDEELSSISADTFHKQSPKRIGKKRTDSTEVKTSTAKDRESVLEGAGTSTQNTKEVLDDIQTHEDQQPPIGESTRLKAEYDRMVKKLKDKEDENNKKSKRIYDLLDKYKEETTEMLKKSSQCWRTAWQLRIMSLENKRLWRLLKNYENALITEQHGFCHTTWEELIKKGESVCNILGKENKFLKRLIANVAQSKAYEFDLYTLICKRKETKRHIRSKGINIK